MPELRDYQRLAVAHTHANPRSGLFLDMGLGKTAVALSSLRESDLPALVTAPKRVALSVWPQERELWRPDLSITVVHGTPTRRRDLLAGASDITVIGRDNLRDALAEAQNRVGTKRAYQTLILDELSAFKTPSAIRTKAAYRISKLVPRVIGLTGTPNPNGYLDLYAPLRILDDGKRLGKTLGAYRERYFTPKWPLPNGVIPGYTIRPGADKRILELISDICLSMETDGRVELPPVTYNSIPVPLPPAIRKLYKRMEDTFVADFALLGEVHTAGSAGVLVGKLQQLTAGFMYVDDADIRDHQYDWVHNEKMNALREVVDGTGSPVLVFYRFRAELDQLRIHFPESEHIDDSPDTIARWNAGKVPVMLAHPASAGHGLNLQHGGHTIVWTTPTWSLEEWMQANKRLARSGQRHPVVIHSLISPGTIDGATMSRLQEKKTVQQALLDYLESPI